MPVGKVILPLGQCIIYSWGARTHAKWICMQVRATEHVYATCNLLHIRLS